MPAPLIIRFIRLPGFVQVWLLPTWVLLGLSRALILLVHFSRLAPHLGEAAGTTPWLPLLSSHQVRRARLVGVTTQIAARRTPWNSNCFAQALTARWLLRLFGVPCTVCFGLRRERESNGLVAHAWVSAGPIKVTGGTAFEHYTVVGAFVSQGQPYLE